MSKVVCKDCGFTGEMDQRSVYLNDRLMCPFCGCTEVLECGEEGKVEVAEKMEVEQEKNFKYFVSYFCDGGVGSGTVDREVRILNVEQVIGIAKFIEQDKGFKNVVIINYILMEEAEAPFIMPEKEVKEGPPAKIKFQYERPVGERFAVEGGVVEVTGILDINEVNQCRKCYFSHDPLCDTDTTGPCMNTCRSDKKDVYFELIF